MLQQTANQINIIKMQLEQYTDIGQYLRDVRESLNITIAQAAIDLNIKAKYLENIENGNLVDMPSEAFLRGFIRKYANYLQVDSDQIIVQYQNISTQKVKYFVPQNSYDNNIARYNWIWISLIAILAIFIYWQYSNDSNEFAIDDTIPKAPKSQIINSVMNQKWQICLNNYNIKCFQDARQQDADYNNFKLTLLK
jgi:transcriptional regulator with XRE-family HTH domain